MRVAQLLALLAVFTSAAGQDEQAAATLEELLERIRASTPVEPACPNVVDAPGENLPLEECLQREHVCIRIHNETNISFDSFTVSYYGQSEEFGPISPGQTSQYRQVGCAYWYNYAEAHAGERRYVRTIIDHTGDAFLPTGLYTMHYRVREFDVPLSGDGWILHGQLGEQVEVNASAP